MKTKSVISAVMALLYSAQAAETQQMTVLDSETESVIMSLSARTEQQTAKKAYYDAKRAANERDYQVKIKQAADVWRAGSRQHWKVYDSKYRAYWYEQNAVISKLPTYNERKAAWDKTKAHFANLRIVYYDQAMKPYTAEWFRTSRALKAARAQNIVEIANAESADTSRFTLPHNVSQTCDGSLQRLYNEQSAHLFELAELSTSKYTDVSFPADKTSWFWNDAQHWNKGYKAQLQKARPVWKRVSQVNKNATNSIWGSQGVQPQGVRQGALGNCWWMALVSGLAEHPERIRKLFTHMDYEKGIYELEFFSRGEPLKVVVDDQIAYAHHRARGPYMAQQSLYGAWWAPILEKASAKFYGTYQNMYGGHAGIVFEQLTGFPGKMFHHNKMNKTEVLELIKTSDDSHHIMQTGPTVPGDGLVMAHAYTVLRHMNWQGNDLIQLRNPWGHTEWKGKWSDSDKVTNSTILIAFREHVKNVTGHDHTKNDGKFWMSIDDYYKHMAGRTFVGYYLDDFKQTRVQGTLKDDKDEKKKRLWYTLKNPVKQHVYLSSYPIQQLMFMDWICLDEKKVHSSNGYKAFTFKMDGKLEWGNAFLEWKELAAGDYKIEFNPIFSKKNRGGILPFSLQAFSSLKNVQINPL